MFLLSWARPCGRETGAYIYRYLASFTVVTLCKSANSSHFSKRSPHRICPLGRHGLFCFAHLGPRVLRSMNGFGLRFGLLRCCRAPRAPVARDDQNPPPHGASMSTPISSICASRLSIKLASVSDLVYLRLFPQEALQPKFPPFETAICKIFRLARF